MMINGMDASTAISIGKKVLLEMIQDLVSEIRPTMSIEDIQRVYTKSIDEVIFKEEESSHTTYVGGEFSLNYIDEKNYNCAYRLFFQGEDKKLYEVSAKSKPLSSYYLSMNVRGELKTEHTIKFEIPEPSTEARDKYNRKNFVK
ncbi:MAG: hypothetical protein IJ563_02935 [Selenomonadaceae bacterium]|nr:hypothetical protein [Selenomonadaceae bacterium]